MKSSKVRYENSLQINSNKSFLSKIYWGNIPDQLSLLPDGKYMAFVDDGASWFYEKRIRKGLKLNTETINFEPSEEVKSQATVDRIHNSLFESQAGRDAILLAVGGGVTCDVAGYAASTYKRGIRWVAIPTTLLAQVDASVGGKTAINTEYGKNTIGSFYPPEIVLIAHEVIQDLPPEIFLEGVAEIVKMLILFDLNSLKPLYEKGLDGWSDEMTKKSVEYKAKVVGIDPWENNLRASLNYGHTFGHAIESATGLRHGLAVSQGIRVANRVANILGIMKNDVVIKIDKLLNKLDFPNLDPSLTFAELKSFIKQDKKNVFSSIKMVLIDGEQEIKFVPKDPTLTVSMEVLEEAYDKSVSESI